MEDNRFSISIHYRNCARIDVPRVKDVVINVQSKHERIRMGSGKEVSLKLRRTHMLIWCSRGHKQAVPAGDVVGNQGGGGNGMR